MQTYANASKIPLSVAVYLATDLYDHIPNTVSATSLMKPIRQRILMSRLPQGEYQTDISALVKSRTGTSIHDGIEKAWTHHYQDAMRSLGYPQSVIERIVINPDRPLTKRDIPVYMERRAFRTHMGYQISGKFDFVAEGRVEDFKSTGTFTWTNDTKSEDYQLQLSIYRWLNPDIITQDVGAVQFFFTDWAAYNLKSQKNYPPSQTLQHLIPLLSLEETEAYVSSRLMLYDQHKQSAEQDLPPCSDKELWRKDAVWKVYKDPKNQTRAMNGGTFDTSQAAHQFMQEKKGGIVVEIPGQVTACKYCAAFPICTQKDYLIANGSLILES